MKGRKYFHQYFFNYCFIASLGYCFSIFSFWKLLHVFLLYTLPDSPNFPHYFILCHFLSILREFLCFSSTAQLRKISLLSIPVFSSGVPVMCKISLTCLLHLLSSLSYFTLFVFYLYILRLLWPGNLINWDPRIFPLFCYSSSHWSILSSDFIFHSHPQFCCSLVFSSFHTGNRY